MSRKRKWSEKDLKSAVKKSYSVRSVIRLLGLIPTGGNYDQVNNYINEYSLGTKHFTGMLWSKGKKLGLRPITSLEDILVKNSNYQSFKLKKRLFSARLRKPKCEECGWAKISIDGRLPLELDHINGDRHDNRLENLRVLCPNCHSLQITHRGKNRKRPSAGIGRQPTLKML
jgi:Zn finger protein HypA/HybF involved in hydrogenase expression